MPTLRVRSRVLASGVALGCMLAAASPSADAGRPPIRLQYEQSVAHAFNKNARNHGFRFAFSEASHQAAADAHELPVSDRLPFARAVVAWLNELRVARTDVQPEFHVTVSSQLARVAAFKGPVPWRRSDAETEIGSYLWDDKPASDVRCRGVYDSMAWHDTIGGAFFFVHFRCSFAQDDGRSQFLMTVSDSAARFSTTKWVVPTKPSTGGGGGNDDDDAVAPTGGCSAAGIVLRLDDVTCRWARLIYSEYRAGMALPQPWECETVITGPRECGVVDVPDYAYPEFSW